MAFTWTRTASVFNTADGGTAQNNSRMQAACASGAHGVILAINVNTSNSQASVYRSTNGGYSWTLANHGSLAWGGQMALAYGGGTNWFAVTTSGQSYYSTDDGSTWTATASGTMAPQGSGAASDNNGTVVFAGASSGTNEWVTSAGSAHTFNNGAYPTGSQGASVAGGSIQSLTWDGTNFVVLNNNTAGTQNQVLTAPSGFAQGAGPTWTVQQNFTIGGTQLGGANALGLFGYLTNVGFLTSYGTAGINFSSSYASIVGTSALQTPFGISSSYVVCCPPGGALAFIGTNAGSFAESSNGTVWTTDSPGFIVTGAALAQAVYDPAHLTYVVFSNGGDVSVGAITFPIGHYLPAISPGQVLTTNPNVTAPAGRGGDQWGANGGGITPVGGGITGQKGYDRPIAVTVSDCERASNYIVSPNVAVVGAEGNATLSAQTIDSALPQGDSTLGNVG